MGSNIVACGCWQGHQPLIHFCTLNQGLEGSVIEGMPSHSPATSSENQIYNWRGYNVRYQVSGPANADHTLMLIHGLFVNLNHWRRMLTGLQSTDDENGSGKTYRVYALDLLGSGWSDKHFRENRNEMLKK